MIRAVLFDVAGVLTESYSHLIVQGAEAAGADMDALAQCLVPVFAGERDTESVGHRLERGEVTLDEFLGSLGPSEADARAVLHPDSPHFFGHRLAPQPEMHAFVAELAATGIATAVVSNNVREWQSVWEVALPPLGLFDTVVLSAAEGVRKPNPRMYQLALDRLSVAPEEAVFLDDFAAMVEGARAVGLHAIHVEDHNAAIAQARALITSLGA